MLPIICIAAMCGALVCQVFLLRSYLKGGAYVVPFVAFFAFIAVLGVSVFLTIRADNVTVDEPPSNPSQEITQHVQADELEQPSEGATLDVSQPPEVSVDIVVDLEQFSMVSLEELRTMLGSEGGKDPYGVTLTDTLHGTLVHLDVYTFNNDQLEFIIWDDKVVRGTYNAPSYWGGEPIHFDKKEDIPLMFGISVDGIAVEKETPVSYEIMNVNNKVDNFWVTLMDDESNTFDQVKATYYRYLA